MTINFVSDIHVTSKNGKINWLGFHPGQFENADVFVFAGDLGSLSTFDEAWKSIERKNKGKFGAMLMVKGNHDYWYYGNDKDTCRLYDIEKLEHYVDTVIGDTAFIGCTLWTPVPDLMSNRVTEAMNDFVYIPNFNTRKQTEIYLKQSAWLREKVNSYKANGLKTVVITHHMPRRELITPKFVGSPVNYAFAVMDGSCDDIQPDLWLCGHGHTCADITIGKTRYVMNPVGYRYYYTENPDANRYNCILTI